LATFVAAIGLKQTNYKGANAGLLAGVLINVYLWLFCPQIFWFWWNAIGAVVTLSVCVAMSYITPVSDDAFNIEGGEKTVGMSKVLILVLFTLAIILFSYFLPSFF
jgi:hypothetical protein